MSKVVPYKFEVLALCQIIDDEGRIVSEQPAGAKTPDGGIAPVTVFGVDGLIAWATKFGEQLEAMPEAPPSN